MCCSLPVNLNFFLSLIAHATGLYRTVCFIHRVACEFCDEAGHDDIVTKLVEVINLRFQY